MKTNNNTFYSSCLLVVHAFYGHKEGCCSMTVPSRILYSPPLMTAIPFALLFLTSYLMLHTKIFMPLISPNIPIQEFFPPKIHTAHITPSPFCSFLSPPNTLDHSCPAFPPGNAGPSVFSDTADHGSCELLLHMRTNQCLSAALQ